MSQRRSAEVESAMRSLHFKYALMVVASESSQAPDSSRLLMQVLQP